ncbi:acyl-CoA dehydrogenase C-terminal domain-containing protein [Azotobacter sp. CWF10]
MVLAYWWARSVAAADASAHGAAFARGKRETARFCFARVLPRTPATPPRSSPAPPADGDGRRALRRLSQAAAGTRGRCRPLAGSRKKQQLHPGGWRGGVGWQDTP